MAIRAGQEGAGRQFKKDPEMIGHTLGELTPKGYAVLDKTGKLIGHYAK